MDSVGWIPARLLRVNHSYFLHASGPSSSSSSSSSLSHVYSENIYLVLSSLSPSLCFASPSFFFCISPTRICSLSFWLSVCLSVPVKRVSTGKDQTGLTGNRFKLCPSVYLSIHLSIDLSASLSVCLSFSLSFLVLIVVNEDSEERLVTFLSD